MTVLLLIARIASPQKTNHVKFLDVSKIRALTSYVSRYYSAPSDTTAPSTTTTSSYVSRAEKHAARISESRLRLDRTKRQLTLQIAAAKKLVRDKLHSEAQLRLNRTRNRVNEKIFATRRMVQEKIQPLKENIFTIPNGLCVARICSTPLLGYLVITQSYLPAFCLFLFSGLTDMLDGQIARRYPSQKSMAGSILDPLADKLLVGTLVFTLTISGLIPIPLTVLIVARDACLMGSAFYIRYASLPPPRTFSRYFDPSLATVKFQPTTVSKINTAVQLGFVAVTLAAPVFNYVDFIGLKVLWYVTAATTLASGVDYLFKKNTYTYMRSRRRS